MAIGKEPLKRSGRRPVPEWLAAIELPAVDALAASPFPLGSVLQRSLYYPASGIDGMPVEFLGGFIHSFIYVDYGMGSETVARDAERRRAFRGYRLAGRKSLRETDLAPNGWRPVVPGRFRSETGRLDAALVRPPFGEWYIYERLQDCGEDHGPARFSLVYLGADGVAAYQALYVQNHSAPLVLAIIQPGLSFGGNYTDFMDSRGFLADTVLRTNGDAIPDYLVCSSMASDYRNDAFWPADFPTLVEYFRKEIGIWKGRQVR